MWKNSNHSIKTAQIGKSAWSRILSYNNPSNCKLKTFDSVGYYLENEETRQKTIDAIADRIGRGSIGFLHLKNESSVEILAKHFKIMSAVKVDVGYGKPQYHVTIAKKGAWNGRKTAPTTDIIEELASTRSKKKVKQILKQYLILIDK